MTLLRELEKELNSVRKQRDFLNIIIHSITSDIIKFKAKERDTLLAGQHVDKKTWKKKLGISRSQIIRRKKYDK